MDEPYRAAMAHLDELARAVSTLAARPRVQFMPRLSPRELRVHYHETERFLRARSRCLASWFVVQILANGAMVPYSRCHGHALGNVTSRPFADVWNGSRMRAWRRFMERHRRMPMCRRCDMVY